MRVLCAAVSGPGHVFPIVAIARALAAAGAEPILAFEGRMREHVASQPFPFVDLPPVPSPPGSPFEPYVLARRMAEMLAPRIAELRLDAAVCDGLALGPGLAAEMHGVPWATFYPHALPFPSADLPPFGAGYAVGRTPLGRRRDRNARTRVAADLSRARDECNRARTTLGLSPREDITAGASATLVLAGTYPALEPARRDWPAHARVTGPCLWEPPAPAPEIEPGYVLVAASTAHGGPLAHAATDALERLGRRAVVTTGATDNLDTSRSHVTALPFASHDALLRRAAAVVCNGGHGIVARAIRAGVPLVVLPQHGDQKENAARVARAGAGVVARSPRRIEGGLRRVLGDPRYAAAAKTIAATDPGGAAFAARVVLEWAEKQREAG